MPKFDKLSGGRWRCACSRFFGIGGTRATAFDEWRKASAATANDGVPN